MTPAQQQFKRFKAQHPDYVLFFRMGDFYELFFEDAKLASKIMGINITKAGRVPMAGVPAINVEVYLRKIIQAGHKCAICDPAKP